MTHTNDPKQTTGALRSDQNALIFDEGFSFSGYERNPLYLNLGNGKYQDISGISGADSILDGRAVVFADLDNDGDHDIFLTTINEEGHLLLRNNVGAQNNFVRVLLQGAEGRARDAFGTVVRVRTSAGTLTQIKAGGSGYISQHDPRLLFGIGNHQSVKEFEVTWPEGVVEHFPGVSAGATVLLAEGSGKSELVHLARASLPEPLTRAQTLARGLKLTLGSAIADLPLRALSGEETRLSAVRKPGRKTLINIWATWCFTCAKEMPELEKLRPLLAARGIDVVGLNVDTNPEANIRRFLERTGATYPNYAGGVPAIELLYATDELAVPMSILLDENGKVADVIPGWSVQTHRRLLELAGEPAQGAPAGRQ